MKKRNVKVSMLIFITAIIIFYSIYIYNKYSNQHSIENIERNKIVREPVVAGAFYPADKEQLSQLIGYYISNAKSEEIGNVKGLIVPHAGYIYSGQVAAEGFKLLDRNYNKVIIIGTNHIQGANVNGISVPESTHYKTPLGEVNVSRIVDELLKEDLFVSVPLAHTSHIIEVELPFLQKKLGDFEILPLISGALNIQQIKEAADILSRYIDDNTLVIVSSDLSHYYAYDDAVNLDTTCISNIAELNFQEAAKCEACSLYAIFILMELAQRNNWKAKVIDYKNSGDTAGTKDKVVGYASIAFYEESLSKEDKRFLIKLARTTLEQFLKEGTKPSINEGALSANLLKVQGCFVTLNKHKQLRGCIGHILPQEALYKCVIDNAINAAINDIRFNPVTYGELNDIEVDISVLSIPKKLEFNSPEDLLEKLVPLRDGVIINYNNRQSTYLPQVWEQLPDKKEFLSSLCLKQGSVPDCWKKPDMVIHTYNADVFYEHG